MTDSSDICVFHHPGFAALSTPLFRLTEGDRLAALAYRFHGSDAVVPLPAVGKLFGIAPGSDDARKLQLVGQSLRFVTCLRLGDPLPPEVLTGEASWAPSAYHRQVAAARVQLQLVNWLGGIGDGRQITSQMLIVSLDDPTIRARVQEAIRRAAHELQIAGGIPAIAAAIGELAGELAFIEALRDQFLVRVHGLIRQLLRLGQGSGSIPPSRRETLFQVGRLATHALIAISTRFDQVDALTADILPALRGLEGQRDELRANRNWIYSMQIVWEPVLAEWEGGPGPAGSERVWKSLDRLYRFLAQRHMPAQEWQTAFAAPISGDKARSLVW